MRKILGAVFLVICISLKSQVFAHSEIQSDCPDKFVGKVVSIHETDLFTQFPKQEIQIEVTEDLEGSNTEVKTFKIIKNGPHKFTQGQFYSVKSSGKWLCSSTKVDEV